MKDKKQCKVISRITPDQAFHLLRRTRSEGKTQSDLIRQLIDQDKKALDQQGGLSLKAVREKATSRNNTNL